MTLTDMRDGFAQALLEEGERNEAIVALAADTVKRISRFAERFPGRAFNVGIAEQNLVGIAAGMALCGRVPVVSSIGTFMSMRCYEQVRNDVGYQKANVKIVATECGVSQGSLGITHMAVEDMGIMRCIPNVTVVAPADPYQAYLATKAILQQDGAAYMRFGSEPTRRIYENGARFELGRVNILRRGGAEVALVAVGAMVEVALQAATLLSEDGVAAWVADVHTLKPLDAKAIGELARSVRQMLTLEEHVVTGGLGSAVTEVVAAESGGCTIRRLGLPDEYLPVGSRQELLDYCGLTAEKVRASALAAIRE